MRRFRQVDVFCSEHGDGNPLPVIVDAEGMSDDQMQRLAQWMGTSETAFLLPAEDPDADYRVRIFTLARELPFAGHPTLGSCHVWLEEGGSWRHDGTVVQECAAGLIKLQRRQDVVCFEAPPLLRADHLVDPERAQTLQLLGVEPRKALDARWADNGPGWIAVLVEDAATVLALDPVLEAPSSSGSIDIGVLGFYPPGSPCLYEVRAFFSDANGRLREDPVTGSFNAAAAQWMLSSGRAQAPYHASQGTRVGRQGRILVDQDEDWAVWVGGAVRTRITGQIDV